MPGLVDSPATPLAPGLPPSEPSFAVLSQRVWLDINPLQAARSVTGKTEITLVPSSADLRTIKLSCRQARITRLSSNIGRAVPSLAYSDPYQQTTLPGQSTAHQWHMLHDRLENQLKPDREPEVLITLPKNIRLVEKAPEILQEELEQAQATGAPVVAQSQFQPFTIYIDFVVDKIRDGLQYVGCEAGDLRYPHVYTQARSGSPASCLFPCVDDDTSRYAWDISISCPKTLGDALVMGRHSDTRDLGYSEEDKARDLIVVCSGDLTDEITDSRDTTKKTTTFHLDDMMLARHIGFAIGPFEQVNLAVFRESQDDEKLGKSATPVHGFCLPGRTAEVRNTCFPLAKAIDTFLLTYGAYPFSSYKITFVDDMVNDCMHTAALTICSSRLLFPEDILEPMHRVTRQLTHAVASQWAGISTIPAGAADTWITVGLAYYMADNFLRKLAGNNEYRWQHKRSADLVIEADVARPPLHEQGALSHLDPSVLDFIALKAPMVLFILDRRLIKASGTSGLVRIINKIFLNTKTGDLANGALSTSQFLRMCERTGHVKLDAFFQQWVFGAGCPRFQVTQRFNKKRLVVEMSIKQVQVEAPEDETLKVDNFLRDVKEEDAGVYAGQVQAVFTGPMTIRIHEADGTPYEHIVEIKEMITRLEIPYNTKYKRLKRSRRQRERLAANGGGAGEGEEALLHCLGDVLQSEEEVKDWRIAEWSKEEEDRMNTESFEWIRLDADFEWICSMRFNMPPHMYLSQLQQDRDVVAQLESIQYFASSREKALVSSFLVRTLMDRRYFYGIRAAAATALARHGKDEIQWLGLFHLQKAFETLFCMPSGMVRPNDFSDRALHYIQCAIVRAIGMVRDNSGRAPFQVRRFLYEKLRYNDNSENNYSDAHYLQALIRALASTVATAPPLQVDVLSGQRQEDDISFFRSCVEEIDRHRRLDEWLPSYHNLLSIEGLDAKAELMKAGRLPRDASDFLQYTQVASQGNVRVAAFDCLLALGFAANWVVMQWFLFNLSSDPSPYVRERLWHLFGRWLGTVATGQHYQEEKIPEPTADGLIIEGETIDTAREADDARKKTVAGALAALKMELGSADDFRAQLWQAVSSPVLTIPEIGRLLDICSWLYEQKTSLLLTLKYPRYWQVSSEGLAFASDGTPSLVMHFERTTRVRTKPVVKWQAPALTLKVEAKPGQKRKNSGFQESMPAPKLKFMKKSPAPTPRSVSPAPTEEKRKLTLKLKIGSGGAGSPPSGAQTPGAQTPGGTSLKLKLKPPAAGAGR